MDPVCTTDTEALRTSGKDARILNNRGAVFHAQLKFSQAREDYNAALVCDGTFERTFINRAQLNIQRNDAYNAFADLSAVLVGSKGKGTVVDIEQQERHKCKFRVDRCRRSLKSCALRCFANHHEHHSCSCQKPADLLRQVDVGHRCRLQRL